ncbi:MAG: helicase, partial [Smithella sp.]
MNKCTPREIIKEIPNVQTVILPPDWFNYLSDKKSVFVSLYEWMLENGYVSSEDQESLHNRTFVGDQLYK